MKTMALCVATMRLDEPVPGDIPSWMAMAAEPYPQPRIYYNTVEDNIGVVKAYQWLYDNSHEDILVFVHDDVEMYERGWNERLLRQFKDPEVALVGLGGARHHGSPDLYKRPYGVSQLARRGYLSNVMDAEVHGDRFKEDTEVAVLDGFCLAIRRSFLHRIRGFRSLITANIDFFCYDYAICAMARRHGYRIVVVGIDCNHRGGQTSVKLKIDRQDEYERSHKWFYEEFRDVMPVSIK